ncbi:MAG: AbrB/MazE/SpoVT family DNA-binding domain-containing protein [Syntrophobacterales bacterium]|nr:AbrB/MazE/SpoVT family DNA-binding domain-containing protein [Syntrophobacterales bacterium]
MRPVFRSGNSLAITLPSLFIKAHNIKEGDHLKLVIGETLQVHPPDKPHHQ